MSIASSAITVAKQLRKPLIADQLLGLSPIDITVVKSYDDFEDIFHIRHDLIHSLICDARNLEFGEKPVSDVITESKAVIKDNKYFDEIKNQTPDYLNIKGNVVKLIEISISRSAEMQNMKVSKYSLLSYFFRNNGFIVESEYIIINPDSVYQSRDSLIKTHKLSDPTIDLIKKICERCRELESRIKSTDEGQQYYLQKYNLMSDSEDLKISIDDVIKIYRSNDNKPFHSEEDLNSVISENVDSFINYEDDVFLDFCCEQAEKINPKLASNEEFNENTIKSLIDGESKRAHGFINLEPRSVFPLPFFHLRSIDASVRSTEQDAIDTNLMAMRMVRSEDPVLGAFGTAFLQHFPKIVKNEDFPFEAHFSSEIKREIALEGPGRKQYARRPDMYPEHAAKQKEHSMYSLGYDFNTQYLERFLFLFSDKKMNKQSQNIYSNAMDLTNLSGFGLDYVKLCQSIYREVNINSLRSDRRKKHILKSTGIKGLFVLIYKGPKLRVGEMPSQIWFKVIIDNDYVQSTIPPEPHWMFKRLTNSSTVSHSHWLSVDAHRLDHYLRAYDKILMAYYSLMIMRYRTTFSINGESDLETKDQLNKSLYDSCLNDSTNSLGLIIAIYMEDRRSTSKLLQNVRYLVMTMISIYKFPMSVFEKSVEPVRSPLQLYILRKMVSFTNIMKTFKINNHFEYGSVKYDNKSRTFLDNLGGARVMLPRPLITDSQCVVVDFAEILCEMYFTMLFNKNQDDPTHSSFQILSKMLEGEESMQNVKKQNNHLGYHPNMTDTAWSSFVIHSPHSHQFSSKAIEIGSKLNRERVGDKLATDVIIARRRQNVNKPLDEFSTLKSSAVNLRLTLKPDEVRQNSRRRCVEGIIPLLVEGWLTSSDVANFYLAYPVEFQIFKKNQIGGVREILILTMISRIKINIIETISRNICSFDKRETLTHGPNKNDLIKECLYESRRKTGKRMTLFFSLDKSRWGPSFVPIQFLYLFTPFKKQLGNHFLFIMSQLILHQNKRCILPERLIQAWRLDPKNLLEHRKDVRLQQLKEHFLKTGDLFFDNESNMGQGILHYTSSLLHASMISFRDELYKRLCVKFGFDHDDHFDLFSSDDSFTAMSIEVHKMSIVLKKLDIFMRCQEVSERLFNCTTSKSKSSINPIIGEFNSLFMSNLTFFPTLFKFAIASVHPTNTDSFYRMVKESYASCRQIVENGGTLDLYLIANYFNKKYCEEMYHTNLGGVNDPRRYNLNNFPYQIGLYPVFNPSLMVMFGPEFHNYKLYKMFNLLNENERKIFISSHKIIKGGVVETMAELEDGETMLGGLLRIEAKSGPIKQYLRIKRDAESKLYTREKMEEMIVKNPLIIFDPTISLENIKFKVMHKLMVPGAQESLKLIASSIYYGRMSASISAKAFYIPNHEMDLRTYDECLLHLLEKENVIMDVDKVVQFLYPKWPEYDLFMNEIDDPVPIQARHVMEIQTSRKLSIFKVGTNLNNSIYDIIKFLWLKVEYPDHERNKLLRDVQIIKKFYPLIKDSLEETKEQFNGSDLDKVKSIILLLLKMYSLRDRSIKAIVFGPSTNDVRETFYSLSERNSAIAYTHIIHKGIHKDEEWLTLKERVTYDDLFHRHNYFILRRLHNLPTEGIFTNVDNHVVDTLLSDKSISPNIKKRIFMLLLSNNIIRDVEKWSDTTSVVLHYWNLKQKYNSKTNTYSGDYDITMFLGTAKFRVVYNELSNFYKFYKNDYHDPSLIYELYKEFKFILNIDNDTPSNLTYRGDWVIRDNKILFAPKSGFHIHIDRSDIPVFPGEHSINVNDITTQLISENNKTVLSINTGLLSTNERYTGLEDFRCFGLSYHKLLQVGAFSRGFDISYKTDNIILSLLDDLDVEKPPISQMTIDRIGIPGNWSVKTKEDLKEQEVEMLSTEIIDSKDYDITWFMDKDDDLKETLESITWATSDLTTFIQDFVGTDLFDTVQIQTDVHFPRRIFNTIKNLKYDCIALSVTYQGQINKSTIFQLSNMLDNHRIDVFFSLVSRYDRTMADKGVESPDKVVISINKYLYNLGLTNKHNKLPFNF